MGMELLVDVSSEQPLLVGVDDVSSENESFRSASSQDSPLVIASPVPPPFTPTAAVENHDVFPVDGAVDASDDAEMCSEEDPLLRVPEEYRTQVGKLLEMGYAPDFSVDQLAELVAANGGDLRATIFAILEQ